ncbi:MAG: VOC family protein [Phycisphaerales bacterium]|jgi:predicted enzyme related to lactoylglutathione lyase
MADRFDTHGDFSWCELLTRNVDGSKKFYKELLGWTMEDSSTEDGSYTILRVNGQPVGGLMKMPPQVPAEAPSYWGTYVTVNNVDETAQKAQQLGAKILVPPTDVPDAKFCVFEDPQGAVISIISYKKKPQ